MGEPETVIRVENLSKRYVISHAAERGRYSTLRDTIAQGAKSLVRRFTHRGEQGVDPTREEFWALKDVSFEVKRGDVVGIIGRNGAGKSTLLKILSRITEPTTGRIAIDGRVASLLEVGTGFHPELTGRENVYLNGSILGMTRAEVKRKFDEIVAFAEIEKFLDTPVKRYSSGMYMRLAFAVAAHLEPEILIVDEVLAVGDAAFQKKCMGKMGEVAKGGRTVLFVSHNMPAVSTLCGCGVMLSSGRVIRTGPIDQVVAEYRGDGLGNSGSGLNRSRRLASSSEAEITDGWITVDGVRTEDIEPQKAFEIHTSINVTTPIRLSPEYLIRDSNQYPILFAPTGLFQELERQFDAGRYLITTRCPSLNLASGTYFIDVMIGESGVRFYDYCECGLSFNVEELAHPPKGWVFRQSRGQGSLPLEVEVTVTKHD